jgi:hypothetical protein
LWDEEEKGNGETDTPEAPVSADPGEQCLETLENQACGVTEGGSPEAMVLIYEQERGALPQIGRLNEERRGRCVQRLRDGLTLDDFRAAIQRARATPFLAGGGERGWRASFDWLIANDTNVRKVLDGVYDGIPRRSEGAPARSREAAAATESRAGMGPVAAAVGAKLSAAATEELRVRLGGAGRGG